MLRSADDVSLQAPGMGQNTQKGLYAEFHMEAEQDPTASDSAGRPIYRDVEYITIRIPGDKDNDIIRAVRPQDKLVWPEQYAAFKAGVAQPVVGTPLEQVPFLSRSQVLEFKAVGVVTAEQLIGMSDAVAQKFMGIHGIRKRVEDFLAAAAGAAPALKLQADLEKRDNEIAVLRKALEDQGKKIESLSQKR